MLRSSKSYDPAGRLHTVRSAGVPPTSSPNDPLFTYRYEPGSHLIKTVTGPAHTVTNTWDPDRDALLVKENKIGTTTVSRYEYGVNAIGQRTSLAAEGSAFMAARTIGWSYNARGEVVSADHSQQAQSRSYRYDAIGNRTEKKEGLSGAGAANLSVYYTATNLNQYINIWHMKADEGSLLGTLPLHDLDGNLESGAFSNDYTQGVQYRWDSENRLLEVETSGTTVGSYRYDPFGRRIMKTAGTGGPTGPTSLFLYDGWNLAAEYQLNTGNWALKTSYLWGQDLSGTMQGAGGVGGLLSFTDHGSLSTDHFSPTYDGNGNVSEYLDDSGAIAAHFEYDPFGQVTVSTDTTNRFPIRFSTKWQDFETGLNYYGYRYYDPQQGRWLNRDLLEEFDGSNMYHCAFNDLSNCCDFLGLWTLKLGAGFEAGGFIEIGWNDGQLSFDVGAGAAVGAVIEFSPDEKEVDHCPGSSDWGGKIGYRAEAEAGLGLFGAGIGSEVGVRSNGDDLEGYGKIDGSISYGGGGLGGEIDGTVGGPDHGKITREKTREFTLGAFAFDGVVAGLTFNPGTGRGIGLP